MTQATDDKKIEVVIPVYNGERFIVNALSSVIHQTLTPNRVIVVDDGSTDATYSLVSEYAKTSPVEIKLVRKENGGLSSARNAGIKEGTAPFIAFLDADDLWVKEKLEKQVAVFENAILKNIGLVYCNYDVIDVAGVVHYKNYKAPLDIKRMRGMVFQELLERNKIASSGSGVLIKREVFDSIGLFDETLRWGEDWDMWLRIAEKYEVDFVEEVLVHIRKHTENMTINPALVFEKEILFYHKWMGRIEGRYPVPAFWADKITFRILSQFPKKNLLKTIRQRLSNEGYKKIFRKSFGSFFLYIPLFFIRQIFNAFFNPHYLHIATRLIRHKGK